MKKTIHVLLLFGILVSCTNIKKVTSLICNGDILEVGLAIDGQDVCSHCVISKEVFKSGISLALRDTTYRISGFTISYYKNEKLLYMGEVRGSYINPREARFLTSLKEGEVISIDCVKIVKEKKTSIATSMLIVVD